MTKKNYQESTRNIGGVAVTTIETDFGRLSIMLNRSCPPTQSRWSATTSTPGVPGEARTGLPVQRTARQDRFDGSRADLRRDQKVHPFRRPLRTFRLPSRLQPAGGLGLAEQLGLRELLNADDRRVSRLPRPNDPVGRARTGSRVRQQHRPGPATSHAAPRTEHTHAPTASNPCGQKLTDTDFHQPPVRSSLTDRRGQVS